MAGGVKNWFDERYAVWLYCRNAVLLASRINGNTGLRVLERLLDIFGDLLLDHVRHGAIIF